LDYTFAFEHPVTVGVCVGIAAVLALSGAVIFAVSRRRGVDTSLKRELWARYQSWLWIVPAVGLPVLAGAFWTILAVMVLSLACYREYARATGFFREKLLGWIVVVGIIAAFFAVLDHWYGLFVAVAPLTLILLTAAAIVRDQPKGYIQRVGLGVFGFMLLGYGLAHLAYFANDTNYRPMMLAIILCVQLNDVFAFTCGKLVGRRKLAPNTSPGKTVGGAVGAVVLTTTLVFVLSRLGLRDTALDHPLHALAMGMIVAVGGILGDLTLSSIKRDIGIKDMGTAIPGHGGVLDRCNSLLLVAPALFHYIAYVQGIGANQPTRLFTLPGP
jgi:phosphatidate cytidylyltransferase